MVTTRFLERPEGRLAYDLDGSDGPLVVCAPSMGDLRGEYRFLAPQLVAAGFRVATLDVRGHGESSTDFTDYSAAAVGSDLVALVQHLALGPAFLVGTSMAAGAAVWAAAEAPDRVAGLVLIGPFVRDVPTSAVMRALFRVMMLPPWGRAVWTSYYGTLYPSAKPPDFAAYRKKLNANLREPGRFAAFHEMTRASKAACEARLPEVKAPALVVMGARDPDFADPAAEAQLVAERLRAQVCLVDGAGHYPHAEVPAPVAARIVQFLNDARG